MSLPLEKNIPLAPLTTLKIGGPARLFLRAESEGQVADAVAFATGEGMPLFILGGGSNILVSDNGFDGLVLQLGLKGISMDGPIVTARSGEDWDAFVHHCVEKDLAGIECMSGIPGFVGGTPVQNVGAYGQEVSETIRTVRVYDRRVGDITELSNAECGFTYRTSIFNTAERERYIVLSVAYELRHGGDPKIVYRDLIDHFGDSKPSLKQARDAVIAIRREKSMVIDAGDPNSRSAGSFFKNPIADRSKLDALIAELGQVPAFEFGSDFKVPAAWLIERAGFRKGFVYGNAGISSNHTLAIINRGDAKAADIVGLKDHIQETVASKFGIALEPEPVFVGF